jgi:hypothetical protein
LHSIVRDGIIYTCNPLIKTWSGKLVAHLFPVFLIYQTWQDIHETVTYKLAMMILKWHLQSVTRRYRITICFHVLVSFRLWCCFIFLAVFIQCASFFFFNVKGKTSLLWMWIRGGCCRDGRGESSTLTRRGWFTTLALIISFFFLHKRSYR